MAIPIEELDQETLIKLGLTKEMSKPREYTFTKDQVRTHGLNVMAVISKLSQKERRRVLQHCLKINEV
tara:strand:+ start:359 stop:562 length:204 start_codon:yes stop_codon:yes gene_type:complete